MFDPDSRYAHLKQATLTTPDGREVRYVERRLVPRAGEMRELGRVRVEAGDRLDLIAERTLGQPLAYWLVCDANEAMSPLELTERAGRVLRIAAPKV